MEEWRNVVGYEGWYQISSIGRTKRVKSGQRTYIGRILKARSVGGYLQVNLSVEGKIKFIYVHTLVLEAFVGPRPLGHECNHKNGIKSDNRVENLEWITHRENAQHASKVLGRWGGKKSGRGGKI